MTRRGHGPTEQREWGELRERLTQLRDNLHFAEYGYGSQDTLADAVNALSEAEAALSRVEAGAMAAAHEVATVQYARAKKAEAERDELAAHLERVRERVWPYRSENEYDPGSTPGPPPDRYFEGVGDLADAVLSLLPDPKGEATICCCYSEECPIHGTPWRCGDCGADWGPGVLDCRYCASADPKGER